MKKVYADRDYSLYEYSPRFCKPLAINFEKMSFVRRIRFLKEYLSKNKYKVYYLKEKNNVVGHCVIAPGGRRLKCSTEKDIVLGPYYIDVKYRGKGLSTKLILLSLQHCFYSYEYAYDWIEKTNYASIAATKKAGFEKVGELNVTPRLRRLIETPYGDDIIFRYKNEV